MSPDTTQAERREGMLRKVRALLAKADATPFTEEADTFRQKADELMTMFAIEEFELDQGDPARREKIAKRRIFLCKYEAPLREELVQLASNVSSHCRCKIVYYGMIGGRKGVDVSATILGFESDLDYFDLLYTSLQMHMANDLEPKYRTGETLGENVRRMKESGMKWERIAQLCNQAEGREVIPFPGPTAITIYKKECRRVGAQPMKTMPSVYVRNFAAGFVTEIAQRLYAIRRQTNENVESSGHALVLFKDRDTQLAEEFAIQFPDLKNIPMKAEGKFDGNARSAGARSGATADLSRGNVGGGRKKELG